MRNRIATDKQEALQRINSLFVEVAATFAEGVIAFEDPRTALINVFGRRIRVFSESDLSQLMGMAASGLRCSALINSEDLEKNIPLLSNISRLHVPFTLVVYGDGLPFLNRLIDAGCIVLQADCLSAMGDKLLSGQVISEKILAPVLVLVSENNGDDQYELPGTKQLQTWFGDPDDRVSDPTAAQEITLGNKRKRMPGWLHFDMPVFLGAAKDSRSAALEKASRNAFELSHWHEVITETFHQFTELTGRKQSAYQIFGSNSSKRLLITSIQNKEVLEILSKDKIVRKKDIRIISLEQLSPFPHLKEIDFRKCESVLILESVSAGLNQGTLLREFAIQAQFHGKILQNGWYLGMPNLEEMQATLENLAEGDKGKDRFWLNIAFGSAHSQYPKHEVLIQQVKRAYPEISELNIGNGKTIPRSADQLIGRASTPAVVRQYKDSGPPYTRLSRFFDDTACLYEDSPEEVNAEPFQALPVMPPATANFIAQARYRESYPEFKPKACTACGDCLPACPHAALPSTLITVESLLRKGIKQAQSGGNAVGQIIPHLKILIKESSKIIIAKKQKISCPSDFLKEAITNVLPLIKADEDKATKLSNEINMILEVIGKAPIAITEQMFNIRENREAGSGELFSLAVDPAACTGCGICAEQCEEGALLMKGAEAGSEQALQNSFRLFENLPDTSGDTIRRLASDPDFDPFAAIMLSRNFYGAFSGGSVDDQFAADKSIVNIFSALAEESYQPASLELTTKLDSRIKELNVSVKQFLGDNLPSGHYDSLLKVLESNREDRLGMDHVLREWSDNETFKAIDKEQLARKIGLMESLQEWKWALQEGLSGAGRSRYTVVLDKSVVHLGEYPWNHFSVPVLLASEGDTASIALGVFQGQLRHVLDNIRLLRRADLEIMNKYDPSVHDRVIAGLSWEHLSEEERKIVPPIILIAKDEMLAAGNLKSILKLLQSGYPIKLLLLEAGNAAMDPSSILFSANSLWPLLWGGNVYAGRGSLGHPPQLFNISLSALRYNGAAVISVFCPQPYEFNINPKRWIQLNAMAVNARAFNPISYNPSRPGNSFGSKLSTEGIPSIDKDWNTSTLEYRKGDESQTMDYSITFADWAFLMHKWGPYFHRLEKREDMEEVSAYIQMEPEARKKKLPVIIRVDQDGKLIYYAVDEEVIKACIAVQTSFRNLREWAGLLTDFPEKLHALVSGELSKKYLAEKEELIAGFEAERKEWEDTYVDKLKVQLKERLMQLAGQGS